MLKGKLVDKFSPARFTNKTAKSLANNLADFGWIQIAFYGGPSF